MAKKKTDERTADKLRSVFGAPAHEDEAVDLQPKAEVAGVAQPGEPETERRIEPFKVAPDVKVSAGDMEHEQPPEPDVTVEHRGPYIAGEPQEHDELPRQQRSHGVVTTQAAVDPYFAEDHNTRKRLKDRPDTIPEVHARVVAVIDLSQAFGLSCDELKAGIIAAVNEEHTETDANCWCGKRHPKKRAKAEDAA